MKPEPELHRPIGRNLQVIRNVVRSYGHRCGLHGHRLDDLVLAANEAAANVLLHGGGSGELVIRSDDQGMTVEVIDRAGILTPNHLATAKAGPNALHGFGLELIRDICDEATVERAETGGSRLRLYMHTDTRPWIPPQRSGRTANS